MKSASFNTFQVAGKKLTPETGDSIFGHYIAAEIALHSREAGEVTRQRG
ncbi:hypothetical protein [Acidobacterium sp. S8]|nr:hypothetical protein [Acidobacterium sp. S8]